MRRRIENSRLRGKPDLRWLPEGRKVCAISSAGRAGGITTVMGLLNVAVGFAFQSFIAAKIGLSPLADAFQWTWAIVTFGATVQLTLVSSVLVPHFQVSLNGLPAIARTRLPLILGMIISGIQLVAAITLAAGETKLLLITSAPSHVLTGFCSLPLARAYVGHRFVTASVGPIANGIALLATTAAGAATVGPGLLGTAMSMGYAAQWLVTSVGIRGITPMVGGAKTSVVLFVGVTGFTLITKLQPLLERAISLGIGEGVTAALGFGQKIANGLLLVGVFGLALTSVAVLSRHVYAARWDEAGSLLGRNAIATFALLATVIAIALPMSHPVVVFLFQRGRFTAEDSEIVSQITVLQLPWVMAAGLTGVFTPCLYALRWYGRVLLGSGAGLFGMAVTSLALSGQIPRYAVATGSSVGAFIALLVTIYLISRSQVGRPFWKTIVRHRSSVVKPFVLLMFSVLSYSALSLSGSASRSWTMTSAGVLVAAGVVLYLWLSPRTRREFAALFAAKL